MFGNAFPSPLFRFDRMVFFKEGDEESVADDEDAAGDESAEDESQEDESADDGDKKKSKDKKKVQWTPELQSELDRRAAGIKKKAKEEAAAELKAQQAKDKAKEDSDKLKAEGKFEEAAKLEKTAREKAEKDLEEANGKLKKLGLQDKFADAAEELNLGFVSKKAAQDAFDKLDPEVLGEDGEGMKKALAKVHKEFDYYFDTPDDDEEDTGTDGKSKGKRQKQEEMTKERKADLAKRLRIRRAR